MFAIAEAERRPRAKRDEQVKPEHGWRKHQRHGDQRFGEQLAAELSVREYSTEPHAERQQDDDRAHPEPQRDTKGRPVHASLLWYGVPVLPEGRSRRVAAFA